MKIVIGSRGSDLALWQANFVKDELAKHKHEVEIKIIVTSGDQIQDLSFDKMEGKGFFTKEIEESLLNKDIDLAVHSHKDLETSSPSGLVIGAVSYRENPADILLINKNAVDEYKKLDLKDEAIVGTSSARRQSLLRHLRDDVRLKDLRGNVPTRVNKLKSGEYDAIVLAAAGLSRLKLDLSGLKVVELDPTEFVPAPAQGVLGLQIREADEELKNAIQILHQQEVANEINIERTILKEMDGGCQLPLGVYCKHENNEWKVYTSYAEMKELEATIRTYSFNNQEKIVKTIVADLKNV